jgi:PAS domain S-box-containing protein
MNTDTDQGARQSFHELAVIMNAAPVHIWSMTDQWTYGRANHRHAAFLGLQPQDLGGKRAADVLDELGAALATRGVDEVIRTGATIRFEETLPGADGAERVFEVVKTPQLAGDGRVEQVVCVASDVTDSRRAAEAVARSEENFRAFIETIDDIVVIGDADGRVIYSNPAATRKLEYPAEELLGMAILDLHPGWARQEAQEILGAMFEGRRDSCPLPLIGKNGALVPVETRVWFGKWNGQDCVFGLCKDLSREQEVLQKFEKLFRMNPALMAITDVESRCFADVNDAFLKVLGYERDDIVGRSSTELGMFADPEEHAQAVRLLAEYGHFTEVELRVRTRDGEIRDGLFSGEVIGSQGRRYFLTVMIDITERKLAESERERTIQELQVAVEQIRTLKGIVPICSGCKKIRDDTGYWEQVEAYVARHTEAQFTHGLCPDCTSRIYPEFPGNSKR